MVGFSLTPRVQPRLEDLHRLEPQLRNRVARGRGTHGICDDSRERRIRCSLYFDLRAARRLQRLVRPHGGPYDSPMALQLTAVFRKVPEGYIGFVEELPGANTQGVTLDEARENLQEAIAMILEANRELIDETVKGGELIREPITVGV